MEAIVGRNRLRPMRATVVRQIWKAMTIVLYVARMLRSTKRSRRLRSLHDSTRKLHTRDLFFCVEVTMQHC